MENEHKRFRNLDFLTKAPVASNLRTFSCSPRFHLNLHIPPVKDICSEKLRRKTRTHADANATGRWHGCLCVQNATARCIFGTQREISITLKKNFWYETEMNLPPCQASIFRLPCWFWSFATLKSTTDSELCVSSWIKRPFHADVSSARSVLGWIKKDLFTLISPARVLYLDAVACKVPDRSSPATEVILNAPTQFSSETSSILELGVETPNRLRLEWSKDLEIQYGPSLWQ